MSARAPIYFATRQGMTFRAACVCLCGAEQLVREEIQAQKVLAKHIASVANMLPPKSPLTVPKVENWHSIANSNADAWDQAISRGMMSLHDQEEELQQRCWDRYNGLVVRCPMSAYVYRQHPWFGSLICDVAQPTSKNTGRPLPVLRGIGAALAEQVELSV